MKSTSFPARLAGLALVLVLGLTAFVNDTKAAAPAGAVAVQAKVKEIRGSASYTIAGGGGQPLQVGMELPAGSVITTGRGSTVILDLGESGALSIKEDSTLSIDKLTVQKTGADTVVDTQLEIRKGSILGNVKKLSAASTYNVTTARGVAGIRGTIFHIFAVGIFRCHDGQLVITIQNLAAPGQPPQVFTVGPGQEVNNSTNAPPVMQQLAQQIAQAGVAEGNYIAAVIETPTVTVAVLFNPSLQPTEVFVSPTSPIGSATGSGTQQHQ